MQQEANKDNTYVCLNKQQIYLHTLTKNDITTPEKDNLDLQRANLISLVMVKVTNYLEWTSNKVETSLLAM